MNKRYIDNNNTCYEIEKYIFPKKQLNKVQALQCF